MVRRNSKNNVIDYKNTIQKSNELSMAKLNQGLKLNQMQLLAYAIYSTQQDGKTEFKKVDFERKFEIKKYQTIQAKEDSRKLLKLDFSIEDLENDFFEFWNVFQSIRYSDGFFTFKWTDDMIPHILELKTFSLIDLTITSKFSSSFSWTLYEYLKGHFGNWYKEISKEGIMKLFNVEDRVTYQNNTNRLKNSVLDVAIEEINEYTELEVWYTEKKIGNKITSFVLHWSSGKNVKSATEKQVTLLQEIHKEVNNKMMDYMMLKDNDHLSQARNYIVKVNDMKLELDKGLSIKKADDFIKDSLFYYDSLENLLELNGNVRDKSLYYNWLEEDETEE